MNNFTRDELRAIPHGLFRQKGTKRLREYLREHGWHMSLQVLDQERRRRNIRVNI